MARKHFSRSDRVAAQLQRELAELIRTEVKDPRMGLVTITAVEVTRDYSHAKVFYTVMNADNLDDTQDTLQRAAGLLRSGVARAIKMFSVPQLHFVYDTSVERWMHLHSLIEKVAQDDALLPKNDDDDKAVS